MHPKSGLFMVVWHRNMVPRSCQNVVVCGIPPPPLSRDPGDSALSDGTCIVRETPKRTVCACPSSAGNSGRQAWLPLQTV